MGMLRRTRVPFGTMPRPIAYGIQRVPVPTVVVEEEPICVPECGGDWAVSFDPPDVPQILTAPWQIQIVAPGGMETCGDCIEWVYVLDSAEGIATGNGPILTMNAAPDCRGLLVNVEGQPAPGLNYRLVFIPSLNGVPFCELVEVPYNFVGLPEYSIPFDATGIFAVNWLDENQPPPRTVFYGPSAQQHLVTLELVTASAQITNGFAWNVVNSSPGDMIAAFNDSTVGAPPYNVGIEFFGDVATAANATVDITPTLDGVPWGPTFRLEP